MQKLFYLLLFFLGYVLFTSQVIAAVTYGSGVYTNLCGTGMSATANTCQKGCNTGNGSCSAGGNQVVKFTCDGKLGECRSNESSFTTYQSVSGTSCGKTVQIDVFSKQCRVNGNWVCGDNDLQDYMVWYSGDCAVQQPTATPRPTSTPQPTSTPKPTATPKPTTTPRPTATPAPTQNASCNNLEVIAGNNAYIPATVTLRASASDNLGAIQSYKFYFGDGTSTQTTNSEVNHTYQVSGTFTAKVEAKDSRGNWRTSSACETQVTTKSVPVVESQKSGCSNIFITQGNRTPAPVTATFSINGYDNKGSIQAYRIDYGDGTTEEKTTNSFERYYSTAGTYEVKGYVKDTQGNWKGGEGTCTIALYVQTEQMQEQPETGTPTLLSIVGIASGLASAVFFALRRGMV